MTFSFKDAIKDAAMMMIEEMGVMQRGALISDLQEHMTSAERGKMFFEVREAVAELIEENKLIKISFFYGLGHRELIALPHTQFSIKPRNMAHYDQQ